MFPTKENPFIYKMEQEANIQDILSQIDPLVLMEKITKFRKLNISTMSIPEIEDAISEVLCWNGIFAYCVNTRCLPAGIKFYRVKRMKGTDIPNSRFRTYEDYWETNPKFLTSYGRLNKPGESLLYVSPDLQCSIGEVRIKEGELFAAIRYTARSEVKINWIGGEYDYDHFGIVDKNAKLVHEILNGFLRDEFSMDVGKGTEYLYKVSEIIAKSYFDLPPRIAQDAWAYSSVQDKTKYNICFRPDIAHDILELDGAMICSVSETTGIRVGCVAVGTSENEEIWFYPIGSDEQKRVFPEIVPLQG